MDQARAREILTRRVRDSFGRVVEVREVSVVRRALGRGWVATLYCVTRGGELRVGLLEIDDRGRVVADFGVDALVEALQHAGKAEEKALPAEPAPAAEAGFSLDDAFEESTSAEPADELERFLGALAQPDLRGRIDQLVTAGDRASLMEARELLPRLLTAPETRGRVLEEMAGIELRLGEVSLALSYLEAAAREFSDATNLEGLERVSASARGAAGEEAWAGGTIRGLLDRAQARLRPIGKLAEAQVFAGLAREPLAAVEAAGSVVSVPAGADILVEGAEARQAFVIRSGLISVRLETPEGGSRVVRSCYPGDLVGETSVLGEPGASCTATLRAEGPAELWRFEGSALRELCRQANDLRERIEAESSLHRLDSFFSMREEADALDARVRDCILACVRAIRKVPAGEVLVKAGKPPAMVHLVVEGEVEHRVTGSAPRRLGRDAFVGLHDALHDLAVEGEYVASVPSSLVCFDGPRLKSLAADAPPEVVAALERFG